MKSLPDDLNDLKNKFNLTDEEIEGYIDFFKHNYGLKVRVKKITLNGRSKNVFQSKRK